LRTQKKGTQEGTRLGQKGEVESTKEEGGEAGHHLAVRASGVLNERGRSFRGKKEGRERDRGAKKKKREKSRPPSAEPKEKREKAERSHEKKRKKKKGREGIVKRKRTGAPSRWGKEKRYRVWEERGKGDTRNVTARSSAKALLGDKEARGRKVAVEGRKRT